MDKLFPDGWRCAECDDVFEYQVGQTCSHLHPITKEVWCDGCVEAAGYTICYDCKGWVLRPHAHHYQVDARTRVDLCDSCYGKRILPPAANESN